MELVDVADSKSADGNIMWVRVPPPAPNKSDNFDTIGIETIRLIFCPNACYSRLFPVLTIWDSFIVGLERSSLWYWAAVLSVIKKHAETFLSGIVSACL